MDEPKVYLEWAEYAEEDYRVAQYLQGMRPVPLDIICYHCQQSTEKHLKAYLLYQGLQARKTHDVQALCRDCVAIDPAFEALMTASAWLTQMATATRYPAADYDLTDADMHQSLNFALEIRDFVLQRLGLINAPFTIPDR